MTKKRTSPARKIPAATPANEEPKATEASEPKEGFSRYQVTRDTPSISHGEAVYPVNDGYVDLPAGAEWYRPLVRSGVLIPKEQ